jgi:hypothetical protein
MEQLLQERSWGVELPAASFYDTDQHGLSMCALLGAIAALYLACDHHETNGLLGAIVGRIRARTVEET